MKNMMDLRSIYKAKEDVCSLSKNLSDAYRLALDLDDELIHQGVPLNRDKLVLEEVKVRLEQCLLFLETLSVLKSDNVPGK